MENVSILDHEKHFLSATFFVAIQQLYKNSNALLWEGEGEISSYLSYNVIMFNHFFFIEVSHLLLFLSIGDNLLRRLSVIVT